MKTKLKIKPASVIVVSLLILTCLIGIFFYVRHLNSLDTTQSNNNELLLSKNILEDSSINDELKTTKQSAKPTNITTDENVPVEEIVKTTESKTTETKNDENKVEDVKEEIVYDGLTKQQLIDKLNRNLNSTLSGTGEIFANYALELGIDPYLAVAIVLHETGCSWDCSNLVKACYNVGGQKGSPGCGGGSYIAYASLEEGIQGFMNNLYNNFYSLGLTTPETINPKYAASTTWASSINNYINKIKAS